MSTDEPPSWEEDRDLAKGGSRQRSKRQLEESLRVMEVNIQIYEAGMTETWMPIATELYKLLIETNPLISANYPNFKAHPVRLALPESSIVYISQIPGFSINEDGKVHFDLFDMAADPIPLEEWLDQSLIEFRGMKPTIQDFIKLMRHNLSAHAQTKPLGGKPGAIENFAVVNENGRCRPAFSKILVDIGIYILNRLETQYGRQPGPRISLLTDDQLHKMAIVHNKAKEAIDRIVAGESELTAQRASEIVGQLRASLQHSSLRDSQIALFLIHTHLARALKLQDALSQNPRLLFQSIASLEMACLLADRTELTTNQELALLRLAGMYDYSGGRFGRRACLLIALDLYSKIADSGEARHDSETKYKAANRATWISLKLLKPLKAMKYFRIARLQKNL